MANDVWDIKKDLRIQYAKVVSGVTTWYDIVADTYDVSIDRGILVEQQVFARPDIGTARVSLEKSSLADFTVAPDYKSNMPFRIQYRPAPDTASSIWNNLFWGLIQNVSMFYDVDAKKLKITITANDLIKVLLNMQLASFSISTGSLGFRGAMNALATACNSVDSRAYFSQAGTPGLGGATIQWANSWVDTPASEILNQFLDAELGWLWCEMGSSNLYLTRLDIDNLQATAWSTSRGTVSNIHSSSTLHYCMDYVELNYDSDQLVNDVKVTETVSTPASDKKATNSTSTSTYGVQTQEFSITMNPGASPYVAMSDWASAVVNAADPKQIRSVSCPALRRDGKTSNVVTHDIAYPLQVEFTDGTNTIQQTQLITRIKHQISADHWEVTLDLWRGI
jgi:hypothetical protein